jgi:hypothetical protein
MTGKIGHSPDRAIYTDLWEDQELVNMENDFVDLMEKTKKVFDNSEVAIDVRAQERIQDDIFAARFFESSRLPLSEKADTSSSEEVDTSSSDSEDTGADPSPEITASEIKESTPLEKKTNASDHEDMSFGLLDSEIHKTEAVPAEQKGEVADIKKDVQVIDKKNYPLSFAEFQIITCLFLVVVAVTVAVTAEYFCWSDHSIERK